MLSQLSVLKVILNEKEFSFSCPPDAQIESCQAALYQFMGFCTSQLEKAKEMQAQAAEQQKADPVEQSKIDTEQTL